MCPRLILRFMSAVFRWMTKSVAQVRSRPTARCPRVMAGCPVCRSTTDHPRFILSRAALRPRACDGGGRELGLPRPFCTFVPNLSTSKTQVCKLMVFELGQLFALAVELDPARYDHNRSCHIVGDVTDICRQ